MTEEKESSLPCLICSEGHRGVFLDKASRRPYIGVEFQKRPTEGEYPH